MIRTRIVEAYADSLGKIAERELGWCLLGEVPVEKKAPTASKPGDPPPSPFAIKVNGDNVFVIGHSWDINTKPIPTGDPNLERLTHPENLPDAILVLIVQKIPAAPSSLVRAPAVALEQLGKVMPVSGRAN